MGDTGQGPELAKMRTVRPGEDRAERINAKDQHTLNRKRSGADFRHPPSKRPVGDHPQQNPSNGQSGQSGQNQRGNQQSRNSNATPLGKNRELPASLPKAPHSKEWGRKKNEPRNQNQQNQRKNQNQNQQKNQNQNQNQNQPKNQNQKQNQGQLRNQKDNQGQNQGQNQGLSKSQRKRLRQQAQAQTKTQTQTQTQTQAQTQPQTQATAICPTVSVPEKDPTADLPRDGVTSRELPVFEHKLQVGEGTYGKVYKATNRDTGLTLALKRLRLESEREGMPITAIREIKLLQALRHPNVVSLLEMVISGKNVYMAFEYLEHDLAGLMLNESLDLSPGNIKSLFRQLTQGLAYLHHKAVLHRDIKPSNILVSSSGKLKLADFGLARTIELDNPDAHYTNRVITLWYRPPELLLGATRYDQGVDVWGIGCMLVELFAKSALFQGKDEISQLDEIYNVMGTPDPTAWPAASQLPWYYMLAQPVARPNIFKDVFVDVTPACFDLAARMLAMNPAHRISAEQALQHEYFAEQPPIEALQLGDGEWHDFEAKQRRRKAKAAEAASAASAASVPASAASAASAGTQ